MDSQYRDQTLTTSMVKGNIINNTYSTKNESKTENSKMESSNSCFKEISYWGKSHELVTTNYV